MEARKGKNTAEGAAALSERLARLAVSAGSLAEDLACLGVFVGAREPAALATGERLAVLARDLNLVVADYFTSLQRPVGVAELAVEAEHVHDPATARERRVDHGATRTAPALRDTIDTAELVVRAQQLHMLMVRRATAWPGGREHSANEDGGSGQP